MSSKSGNLVDSGKVQNQINEEIEIQTNSLMKGSLIHLRKCLVDKNEPIVSRNNSNEITQEPNIITNEIITKKNVEKSSIDVFKIKLICLK